MIIKNAFLHIDTAEYGPRNFSSVKVSKSEFGGGGWLVV